RAARAALVQPFPGPTAGTVGIHPRFVLGGLGHLALGFRQPGQALLSPYLLLMVEPMRRHGSDTADFGAARNEHLQIGKPYGHGSPPIPPQGIEDALCCHFTATAALRQRCDTIHYRLNRFPWYGAGGLAGAGGTWCAAGIPWIRKRPGPARFPSA